MRRWERAYAAGQPAAELVVVGGGLAGCEAAWQAASRGVRVTLFEMRPVVSTAAHRTDRLAELVCSNSLGSDVGNRASGMLKAELRRAGSLLMRAADESAVPAGSALAVDRESFASYVTSQILAHGHIEMVRAEVTQVPSGPCIVATGPLTSAALARELARIAGEGQLSFYDAIAPIVVGDTIDMSVAYRQCRYRGRESPGQGDYINCPMDRSQFDRFYEALIAAVPHPRQPFENEDPCFFEGCLPIEELARRSRKALLYGPMRPVGLHDPRSGRGAYAVVQLRQDNAAATLYNVVGFQTSLRWGDQKQVLSMVPGLERAEFARFGQMHRNSFLNAPRLLEPTLVMRSRPELIIAGQLAGIEGYMGNIASGLVAGVNGARIASGQEPIEWPAATMTGAICRYVSRAEPSAFQPMKANMGLLPPLGTPRRSREHRRDELAVRARRVLEHFLSEEPGRWVSTAAVAADRAEGQEALIG